MTRRRMAQWALAVLIPVVVLSGLELAQRIRYCVRQGTPQWLFYGFRPGLEKMGFEIPSIQVPTIEQQMSSLESVLEEASRQPPQGFVSPHRLIVCFGGSTTAGVYNSEGFSYPSLLGRFLEESSPGTPYRVLNLGQPSRPSDAYEVLVVQVLDRFKPEVAIFYTGYNDMFFKEVSLQYASLTAGFSKFYNTLAGYSFFLWTLREKLLLQRFNSPAPDPSRVRNLEEAFYRNLTVCVSRLMAEGVRVILIPEVLIAEKFGPLPTNNYTHYRNKYRHIPDILRRVAQEQQCEFLDLAPVFVGKPFRDYFVDPVHLTDRGNQKLVKTMLDQSPTLHGLIRKSD